MQREWWGLRIEMKIELSQVASNAVAETAFKIVCRNFPESSSEEHPVFRMKNLAEPEITHFLEIWSSRTSGTSLGRAKVVISHDSKDLYPPKYIADPACSITYYRNNNKGGLIYIETSPVSDEQGLRNIFTLRDVNFLDGSFDDLDSDFLVAEELVKSAWRSAAGDNATAPKMVIEQIIKVLDCLHPNLTTVPVRKFSAFCARVALERSDKDRTFNLEETNAIIGRCLIELRLFPDENWASQSSLARLSRRLTLNMQHAELLGANGVDLDGDALAEEARTNVFKDLDGQPFEQEKQKYWRELCSNYCRAPKEELRPEIPYSIFEQLFTKDTKGMKLGERVENEIAESDPARLNDWAELEIGSGLDRRDQGEAVRFLDGEPENSDLLPLRDLLTRQTLKMVEKVASPTTETITNPLLKLAEVSRQFSGHIREEESHLKIKLVIGKHSKGANATIGLLAFLYGSTLGSVSEASTFDSSGFEFEVDERLLNQAPPPELRDEDEGAGGDDESDFTEETWEPVPLEFHLLSYAAQDSDNFETIETETGFQWYPPAIEMLALFWLLVTARDVPRPRHLLQVPSDLSLEGWVKHAVGRTISLNSLEHEQFNFSTEDLELVSLLESDQSEFKRSASCSGLSRELLFDTFDNWLQLAERFKGELVPAGAFDKRVDLFLNAEMISTDGGEGRLMLQYHPLRLRWIARYLERSEQLATQALSGYLDLNEENSSLYLDWIANLSPHQLPALAAGSNQDTIFASAEYGWTEHFTPLVKHTKSGNSIDLDESCTNEISHQIATYLLAHPNKIDGLSLLIVLPTGASLPARLLKKVRKGDWKNLPITVNVLAPGENWASIIKEFEELPVADRMSDPNTLLPPLQLKLHDLNKEQSLEEQLGDLSCDIGVIPQFLANEIQTQDTTTQNQHFDGTFDVLLDSPTILEGGTKGEAITVSKLPATSDPALQLWSTLVVRHRRKRPISVDMPENTDHVKLMIDFKREAELFELMHKLNHWVITIERHISREQIENLDARPEILRVKEKVGASGLYTLVVSSNSGGNYIIQRLERKLQRILEGDLGASRKLAERIYEEARSLAPGLALQAMGISRITEEMLGLLIAKHVANVRIPAPKGDAANIWISLDDYADWFGGQNGIRADLCRISFRIANGELKVEVLVVEGKLRQSYEPHGELQVIRTLQLFKNVFEKKQAGDLSKEKIDAPLWRSKILDAVNTAGPSAKRFSGRVLEDAIGTSMILPNDIRERFSSGKFSVESLRGIYSICNYVQASAPKYRISEKDSEIEIVETFKDTLFEIISDPEPEVVRDRDAEAKVFNNRGDEKETPPTIIREDERGGGNGETANDNDGTSVAIETKNRLLKSDLNARYQSILDLFSEFGVSVKQPEDPNHKVTEGPASIIYRILPGTGVTPNMIYQKAESLKLALKLKEEQNVRFSIHEGYINIDVPKSDKDRYYVTAQELWEDWKPSENALGCPLGIDQLGNLVEINFSSSNSPHLLIGGTTGSGKSEALNTILYGLTNYYSGEKLRLLLIDPKGTELEGFEKFPHLEGQIGMDDDDAREMLDRAVKQMQWRYERLKAEKTRSIAEYNSKVAPDQQIPWWLIVLDEYADLTSDPDAKKEIEGSLKRLAQKARAAGIHVIIATQKPSAEVISTNLRSNLPAQLALRVKSGTESRVIMDEMGAETLNGRGDAFFKSEGKLVRVQCGRYNA